GAIPQINPRAPARHATRIYKVGAFVSVYVAEGEGGLAGGAAILSHRDAGATEGDRDGRQGLPVFVRRSLSTDEDFSARAILRGPRSRRVAGAARRQYPPIQNAATN